jgi:hypothetical protein
MLRSDLTEEGKSKVESVSAPIKVEAVFQCYILLAVLIPYLWAISTLVLAEIKGFWVTTYYLPRWGYDHLIGCTTVSSPRVCLVAVRCVPTTSSTSAHTTSNNAQFLFHCSRLIDSALAPSGFDLRSSWCSTSPVYKTIQRQPYRSQRPFRFLSIQLL